MYCSNWSANAICVCVIVQASLFYIAAARPLVYMSKGWSASRELPDIAPPKYHCVLLKWSNTKRTTL